MNSDLKEKLIELVRDNKCIYNRKHKNYKNLVYKRKLWEQIGASLGVRGSKAKDTWRTLRDGYIRYRRSAEGLNDLSRKYSHYTWSSQMAFLEGTLNLKKPAGSENDVKQEKLDPLRSPSPESAQSSSSPPPLSPLSLSTLLHQSQSPGASHAPAPAPATRKNDNEYGGMELNHALDHTDLDYVAKTRDWDSVDFLFMSYAKTFKKLSVRRQIKMKVELAKLFADAELEEAENNTHPNPNEIKVYYPT